MKERIYFDRVSPAEAEKIELAEIKRSAAALKREWKNYLADVGIRWPQEESAKWLQLAILNYFRRRAVHKDDISRVVQKFTHKTTAADQQVRHLKTQGGWHILNRGDRWNIDGRERHNPEGCHVLITAREPSPGWIGARRGAVASGDWERILAVYGNACASCGAKIGETHRFDPALKVTSLEKGHMNPNKPLAPGNIIPQCRWCNRIALGNFTFDEQGRPRAIADVRPVRLADKEVQTKVKKWLDANPPMKSGRR